MLNNVFNTDRYMYMYQVCFIFVMLKGNIYICAVISNVLCCMGAEYGEANILLNEGVGMKYLYNL